MKIKVLVCDGIAESGLAPLKKDPRFEITQKGKLDSDALNSIIGDFEAILLRSATKIRKENLKNAPKLKIIARAGVGVDNIDLGAASEKGILVINAPSGNTIAACEHTIALIMSLARKIPQATRVLKSGKWDKKSFTGTELAGKTAGIVGLGKIGREVAKRLKAFEMNILAYDPFVKQGTFPDEIIKVVSLDTLLEKADIITLHVPKNKNTLNLINESTLKKMKKSSFLINCSRGGIVNEDALLEAIESERIAGAALDVFEKEPLEKDSLRRSDNLIITPHLGASTVEAQNKVAVSVSSDVIKFFDGQIPESACNFTLPGKYSSHTARELLTLAQHLGSAAAQMSSSLNKIKFTYGAKAMEIGTGPIKSSMLKGILSQILDEEVNIISAVPVARRRKIVWEDYENPEEKFETALGVEISGISLKGRIAAGGFRFTECNGYQCDMKLEGTELIFSNRDIPGIIGKIGTVLGSAGINIASMEVARNKKGGEALTIIHIDDKPAKKTLDSIRKIKGISSVRLIFVS